MSAKDLDILHYIVKARKSLTVENVPNPAMNQKTAQKKKGTINVTFAKARSIIQGATNAQKYKRG